MADNPAPLREHDGSPRSSGARALCPAPLALTDRDDGLAGQVVDYVRDHIAAQRLKPGDRLPGEATIARALGVSRPVVREASRTLMALGLIEIAPGRAPRVGRMRGRVLRHFLEHALITGQAKAHHVLEVRRGLEISMAALAATRRDQRMVAELEALATAMAEKLRAPEEYVALDLEFHRALAAATANPFYVQFIDACRAAFETSMETGLRTRFSAAELDRVQALHMEILDAVRSGDADAAAQAMTRHFDDALAAARRALTRSAASQPKDTPHG
jgi:DNA-binding FadR family transcriptional regulator